MSSSFNDTSAYIEWLNTIKSNIQQRQIKAATKVNTELLLLYWDLGKRMIEKQQTSSWGDALIPQLAKDLSNAFPGSKGFSRSNLFNIKKWVEFYNRPEIVQQVVGQFQIPDNQIIKYGNEIIPRVISQLPWGHNIAIIDKCKMAHEAIFYLQYALANNWSRTVLIHQIESRLHLRKGSALHNFENTLEKIQADLARETLKNPYNFDFLTIGNEAREKDLETALTNHIQKFLLELGQGFAFVGNQYPLHVGGEDFYLDLLFYHFRLRCFIVVELKMVEFQPEFVGKLNFYLNIVNDSLKHTSDQPTIGILLCKTPNKVIVEYSLKNINTPLGISEYAIMESIPKELKGKLPTIEELENEFGKIT
jgi:predicted nuclease of restriction endonuclease-like (RecB) superfamily